MEEKKNNREAKEILEMEKLKSFDEIYRKNHKYIVGIDEAGRGPLAGPVVIAGVIFDKDTKILGIKDSKKISEKKREKLYEEIKEKALAYNIVEISHETIDEINILNATKEGVKKVVEGLKIKPEIVLVDALNDLDIEVPYVSVIKGDANSYSIAAASILAKVYRDRKMLELDKEYPEYFFKNHKGYGTQKHYEAIEKHGISKIHRKTFVHLDENNRRIKK